jgi:hypothetical protein
MIFEYDQNKNASNKEKHGIDFEEAQALWQDPRLLEVPAHVEGEPRYLIIGRIRNKYWSAVITYRGAKIRLISARRARKEEVKYYENEGF